MLSRCRSLRTPPLSAISKLVPPSAPPARMIRCGKPDPFSLPRPPRRSGSPDLVGYPARRASEVAGVGRGSVHDFTVKDVKGKDVDLRSYKGKVLLIVNVASQCGLTGTNYMELNQLYEKYKDQGLEILVFPCNQFGGEESGTNEQILDFVCTRYQVQYPIFAKVDVNGDNAAPLYKYLKASKKGIFGENIKWNFSKFLIDKNGHVVDRFAPTTSPLGIEEDIKKLLKAV